MKNSDVIREVIDAFNGGDLEAVLSRLHAEIDWALAEGHPYSPEGTAWRGHQQLIENFFMRAAADWDGFTVILQELYDAGDCVVVEVRYTGRFRATGATLAAQGCHVWGLRDGKVVRFQQYVDTAQLRDAMAGGPASASASRRSNRQPSPRR